MRANLYLQVTFWMVKRRSALLFAEGKSTECPDAAKSERVYGCFIFRNKFCVSSISTMLPFCIIAISSAMSETTARSCVIKIKETKTGLGDIWMSPDMRKLLGSLKESARSDYVFPNTRGHSYKNNVLRDFKRALERAGIKSDELDIHSLRRTFITQHVLKGTLPKMLQKLARHKHFSTTMDIYAIIQDEDIQEAAKVSLFDI